MSNPQSKSVYDYIVKNIKGEFWKPGDRIYSESKLCEETGVSRIAVREALEKLVALGIITKIKGSGAFVADLNLEGYMDRMSHFFNFTKTELMMSIKFRMHLEKGNMIEFMDNHTEEDLRKLEECYQNMVKYKGDKEKFYLEDKKFHKILAEGTRNSIIISVYSIIDKILSEAQDIINKNNVSDNAVQHHGLLLEAIKEKDKNFAATLMERQCRFTLELIEKNLKEGENDQRTLKYM